VTTQDTDPTPSGFRIEQDTMGELKVPSDALWGAQTQRAVDNFQISNMPMPAPFIRALGLIKASAARVNADLGLIPTAVAKAIVAAAEKVAAGTFNRHFPVDIFQTGSGTSSNMNANEVIARLAGRDLDADVHPNDHVNHGQSSNDVIPTAIHLSAALEIKERLQPALAHLETTLETRAGEFRETIKTGRTHLMDAMPVSLEQEIAAWAHQIAENRKRLAACSPRLLQLAQGGTAVGTGINAHAEFAERFADDLSARIGLRLQPSGNQFVSLATQDTAVEVSGVLKTMAVSLLKIANDLRWMNSGPIAGLGEIRLPALQPGSSIMPGKVNPVIPESVAMVCAQVIGNDTTITIAGQSGNFQLNVMLPVIASNLLQSIALLANAATTLADKAIQGFEVNESVIAEGLGRNPILVTALNDVIGYERGAEIAKTAYREGRPVLDVAEEMTDIGRSELEALLDPLKLIRPDG
jgi:fumarate hydratase class II